MQILIILIILIVGLTCNYLAEKYDIEFKVKSEKAKAYILKEVNKAIENNE